MNKQTPDTGNLIVAMLLCVFVMIGWEYFFLAPQREAAKHAKIAEQQQQAAAPTGTTPARSTAPAIPGTTTVAGGAPQPREAVLAASGARLPFDNGKIDG